MANRHLSRSVVLQTLFEWDFNGQKNKDIADIIKRDALEFAPGMSDISFIENLIKGILAKREDLNHIIEKAAPDWPLDKISPIDRNVLRIGLYELLFSDRKDVPAKVAINEAIELGKTFGGETSGRFINGVMGAVYKELGEPDKDAVSPTKHKIADIPYESMPIQNLGGAVIYSKDEQGEIYLAFVHDVFGHWTLSKGKLDKDEDVKGGTIRKIKEETDLDITITHDLSDNEYISNDPEHGKIRKQVHYFLAKTQFGPINLGPSGGLNDAKWFKLGDILELNFYNDILPVVTKAIKLLTE